MKLIKIIALAIVTAALTFYSVKPAEDKDLRAMLQKYNASQLSADAAHTLDIILVGKKNIDEQISWIKFLPNFFMPSRQIRDITPLAYLTNAEILDLRNNDEIKDYSPLTKLKKLKILWLNAKQTAQLNAQKIQLPVNTREYPNKDGN